VSFYKEGVKLINFNGRIYKAFKRKAYRHPHKTAITFMGRDYTYWELYQLCGRYRRNMMLRKGSLVCIDMERSVDMVAAMLAVLSGGCCFMLLDRALPLERRLRLKSLADPSIVVTEAGCFAYENSGFYTDGLAYITFTSGSTGQPKGICIGADSLLHAVRKMPTRLGIKEYDRILASSSISFDLFIFETIIALCNGLEVVLADGNEFSNPRLLGRLIKDTGVTVLQMTPSKLTMLMHYQSQWDKGWISGISTILMGGEQMGSDFLKKLMGLTSAKLYNLYGLTEDTIWTSAHLIDDPQEVYIGKPLPGRKLLVLNDSATMQLKEAGDGETGQVYLSGGGLCKQVLGVEGDNDKGGKRLVSYDGGYWYPTGDLAKKKNNRIIYIGRQDNQLKINGYRIEPEELESQALKIMDMHKAMVASFVNRLGSQQLCLFYTASREICPNEIYDCFVQSLPGYMIPVYYFQLDEFPELTNGKVDRKSEKYMETFASANPHLHSRILDKGES